MEIVVPCVYSFFSFSLCCELKLRPYICLASPLSLNFMPQVFSSLWIQGQPGTHSETLFPSKQNKKIKPPNPKATLAWQTPGAGMAWGSYITYSLRECSIRVTICVCVCLYAGQRSTSEAAPQVILRQSFIDLRPYSGQRVSIALGFQVHLTTSSSFVCFGGQTQVFLLVQQAFYRLRHLSNLCLLFKLTSLCSGPRFTQMNI